ncbi:MAG: hypothetical protein ACFFKA_08005 [Candidatus Thorarchaeota archaeon]
MENLDEIFIEIKKILEKNSANLFKTTEYIGSQAKQKPGFHLYGNKEVSLFGKRSQKTYIAGVIQQKNYVSIYFSPIYSHPDEFEDISQNLKKKLKGKSCFNISKLNPQLLDEIETVLKKGFDKYKEIKWI